MNVEDIQKLCELSCLEIGQDEIADLEAKLSKIVALVDELKAADTASIEPLAHPLNQTQRLREDSVTEKDEHELLQRNAPLVERDLYLVPKVIE